MNSLVRLTSICFLLVIAGSSLASSKRVGAKKFTPQQCIMCKFGIGLANYMLRTDRGARQVYKISNNFCAIAHMESPEICSSVTKLFNREVVKVLSYALITPDQICGILSNNTCGKFHSPLEDWEVNLEGSARLNQEEIAKIRASENNRRLPQKPYRVIHMSDSHVDFDYRQGSVSNCDEPLCCRESSTSNKSENSILAGYWGSLNKCDLPLNTFESALKFIAATLENSDDIPYIIWTGDIQPHDVWEQNKQIAMENYDKIFQTIFEYLPNAKIFPSLGNHEMVPVDSFSPSNLISIARDDSPEWLYRKIDSYWSRWLPLDTVKTITKDGFYAVNVQPGLKIISLNTNFCHNKNFWLYINSTDPGNQLEWLIHELQISELEHEQVHIIGHIPPGTGDCLKAWSRNFNRIVRRFKKTITSQFYGHTHRDEFELFYDQDRSEKLSATTPWQAISTAFISGSLTTFIGVNPSFRIYTINPSQNFLPTDYETYYMDLAFANEDPYREPEWKSSGLFTERFGINDTSPESLHQLLVEIAVELKKNNHQFSDLDESKLFLLYDLSYVYSKIFGKEVFNKTTIEERKAFLCKYFTGQSYNYNACNQFIGDRSYLYGM